MRITILGNCGSGKSTLAREISERLNIPHIHLDRFWFEAGGNKLRKEDVEGKEKVRVYIRSNVEKFINTDSWVSDGWYSRVQPMIADGAEQIIFLDIPLWKRLTNHIKRVFTKNRHPELTRWEDFVFIFEIIKRTFTHGRAMRKFIEDRKGNKVVYIRSYKEKEEYLRNL